MAKKMTNSQLKKSLCEKMTNKIVTALKAGLDDEKWEMPWVRSSNHFNMPTNVQSKKPYRGINTITLWLDAMENGYSENLWGSFAQWKKIGARVKKGEKAKSFVVFWKIFTVEETDSITGETKEKTIPYIQYTNVFNVDQVDGYEREIVDVGEFEHQENAQQVIDNTGANIIHGGNRACYIPSFDQIKLPNKEQFKSSLDYYATAFHELAHWTAPEDRCNRRDLGERFGDQAYAFEELVAELSSTFTACIVGVKGAEKMQNNIKYVKSWIEVLENDTGAIMKASKLAQDATDYILQCGDE